MSDENVANNEQSGGDPANDQGSAAVDTPVTETALQKALQPITEVLQSQANTVNDLKASVDSARAAPTDTSIADDKAISDDLADEQQFFSRGAAKSAAAIMEEGIRKYDKEIAQPRRVEDQRQENVRIERERAIAAKSIEHLPNYAAVKDKVEAAMATVNRPEALTNPEAWKRCYAMEIGMLQVESHESKPATTMPPSELAGSRNTGGPSEEQYTVGAKLGLTKKQVEAGQKGYEDQFRLKAV